MKVPKKVALLLTMTLVGGAIIANTSYADSKVENLTGDGRWETAIKISQNGWKTSDEVIIVNESSIVDALCATPFAKAKNAPILLTQKKKLDERTKLELMRLGAKKVYIVGGEGVLDKELESNLKRLGIKDVERISGSDRYQTSLKLAQNLDSIKGVTEIALVNGQKGLADAVSIGSIAAQKNMPILLSESASKSSLLDEFLESKNIKKSYVIGGENSISNSLMNSLDNSVRLGGTNRNDTNAKVIDEFFKSTELKNAYITKDGIKSEDHLIDALAVGVLAAKNESPVIIVSDKISDTQEKVLNTKSFDFLTQVGGRGNESAFNELKLSQKSTTHTVEDTKELEEIIKNCDANDIVNFKPRSGSNKNLLIETKASVKVNIDNNNDKFSTLNIPNGDVNVIGKVNSLTIKNTRKLNINNSGNADEIKIESSAVGFTISNHGTISNIINDAKNSKIINEGTLKTKPTGSQTIAIEGNSISSNNSGSSNSGNNSGGNSEISASSIINDKKSKTVNIEGTGYTVVSLERGDINNTKFSLNGHEVDPTPVNTEGTIVKFEVNPKEKIEIKAIQEKSSNDVVDTIVFNKDKEKYSKIINNESPDKVLVSGPISVFDYHQTNYDHEGNIRLNPQKTTFDLKEKDYTNNTIPKIYSQKTRLNEDVVINYDTKHENANDWKEKIYSVEKVYLNSNKTEKLQYSLEEGKIILKSSSTAINGKNGNHIIKIKSKGYDDIKTKIEIVKEAGTINLSPNYNYIAHSDLQFELEDFNYAIENPIYEVLLDGEKLEGNCVEYHIVSNIITLENECKEKLTHGKHTITVKAHGFEDFERTFYLENSNIKESKIKFSSSKSKSIDAITSASTGGGGSGGGTVMRANLIYDFNMLSNAMILKEIGQETKESEAVLSWWPQMTKDAILTNESDKVINYKYYKNKLNESFLDGKYMTFKEYYNKQELSDYNNMPYNIKYVLEDGLLGNVQSYSQENLKFAPKTNIKEIDDNIEITFEGSNKDYIERMSNIYLGEYSILSKEKYYIEDNKIIIKDISDFNFGINKVKIVAQGYKDNIVEIDMSKENSNIDLIKDKDNNILVNLDKDFKQKIRGLDLNGKNLLDDKQSGNNSGDYYYDGDTIVLKSKLFINTDAQYTITITSDGYKDTILTFIPNRLEEGSIKIKDVPEYVKLNQRNTYKPNEKLIIDVASVFNNDYKNKIQDITINNNKVDFKDSKDSLYSIEIDGENFKQNSDYTITIKSNGYNDFTKNIKIQSDKVSEPSIEVSKDLMGFYTFKSEEVYINDITDVKLNGKSMKQIDWKKDIDKLTLKIGINVDDVITIESNNYKDYEYIVPKKGVENVEISRNSNGYLLFKHNDSSWTDDIDVYLNDNLLSKEDDYKTGYGQIEIIKKLSIGDKINIKSKKFKDYIYIVDLIENKVKLNYNSFLKIYSFNSGDYGWRDNITYVSINGVEVSKNNGTSDKEGYKLNTTNGIDMLNEIISDDEIVIKSNGYKEYKMTIE
ncbi:MAG: cell wall-binding repeat-containing protein [Clostridioides difficile]|nr:cell wall-binding repeat-containing protein [Clostridioides difficile]